MNRKKVILLTPCLMQANNRKANHKAMEFSREHYDLDDLQELVDKETPLKVNGVECPNCKENLTWGHDLPIEAMSYCFYCGQRITR